MTQYSPLTEPYDAAAGRALAKRLRAAGPVGPTLDWRGSVKNLRVLIVGVAFGITLLGLAVTFLTRAISPGSERAVTPLLGTLIPYGALVVALIVIVVRVVLPRLARAETWWRLSRFAEVNGYRFAPWTPSPRYASPLFTTSAERALENHIASEGFDVGNVAFQIGARGTGSRTKRLGYIAMKLDHAMPHIVLEAIGGPATYIGYDRSQRLSLEGDFDKYFTLYCPAEYQRDALYILTPDLMALLIDETATFDVEIVDSWLFAVAPRELDLTDPEVMQRLLRIIETVGAKAAGRTARYQDAREPSIPPRLVRRRGMLAADSRLRSPEIIIAAGIAALAVVSMVVTIWVGTTS